MDTLVIDRPAVASGQTVTVGAADSGRMLSLRVGDRLTIQAPAGPGVTWRLRGATPVLTTASDAGKTIPVDILGRELGWRVEAPKINITRVSAHVVNGEPVAFVQEAGATNWWTRPTPLPGNIHLFTRFEDVDLERHHAVLWVTHREVPAALWEQLAERLVVYRPPEDQNACR